MPETSLTQSLWSQTFWGELVIRGSTLLRYGNEAEIRDWKVRLVWEDACRGVLYLHRKGCDARVFVFTSFDPRTKARQVLDDLRASEGGRRVVGW